MRNPTHKGFQRKKSGEKRMITQWAVSARQVSVKKEDR
jgi:hypothetical protein